jgi:hypothetical protein
MSIRVKVANGVLVPLDPLPAQLAEGAELELVAVNGHPKPDTEPWFPKVEDNQNEGWLSDEESAALQERLNEMRRLGKEHMRKVMELFE